MKKEQSKEKYDVFLFFVLAALILIMAIVTLQQIRIAQFNGRLISIEDSVTRIENSVGRFVGVMERYDGEHERALNIPEQQDLGTEQVAIGDRREETK